MNKMRIMLVLLIVGLICGSAAVWADQSGEETLCIPIGSILLEPPGSVTPKRGPVEFPHSTHFDYTCKTCHHTWEGEAELEGCMTSGCHDLDQMPSKTDAADETVHYYKKAYHTLCLGCHKEIKAHNSELANSGKVLTEPLPVGGPTGCVKCHHRQ